MSEIGVAYASNDPGHLEDFKAWSEQVNAWIQECRAWAETHGGKALILQPAAWEPWRFQFAGLKVSYQSKTEPDWRVKNIGYQAARIPKRSTKEGKRLSAEFDRLQKSPSIANGKLAGMPSHHMAGLAMLSPSVRILGDRLYVAWSEPPKPDPDLDLWSEIPRSEYYGAVERHEAAEAAGLQS